MICFLEIVYLSDCKKKWLTVLSWLYIYKKYVREMKYFLKSDNTSTCRTLNPRGYPLEYYL